MEKVLQCDCGFEARADSETGLVDQVQRHAREVHGMALSPEQVLLLAFRAELSETASTHRFVNEARTDEPPARRKEEQ